VTQAETIVEDEAFRQQIIANAKDYVESNFNENVEYEAYSRMAKEMCKPFTTQNAKVSENVDGESDETAERKVRFGKVKVKTTVTEDAEESTAEFPSTEKQDATKEASGSEKKSEEQNQVVDNKTTRQQKPAGEKKTPESSQISPRPDSTPEKGEKQPPSKTKGGEDRATLKDDGVNKRPLEKLNTSSTPSPRGARVAGAVKTDTRKRTTDSASEKNSPSAASGKGGGTTTTRNGQPGAACPTASDNAKKTATTAAASKRPQAPPSDRTGSGGGADETAAVKPPPAQRSVARRESDTGVSSGPAATSRPLRTTRK